MLRLDNPLEVAQSWTRLGFGRLHVVDLDAAMGRGNNSELIREILRDVDAEIQVGGGIRQADDIELLLEQGATRVVVGTRALEEPGWLEEIATTFPGELIVAADVRDRRVVTRGWVRTLTRDVLSVVEELNELPLAGVLVTAVHREGKLGGTDLFLMEDVAETSVHPVIASGGITTLTELRGLAEGGVHAAVVGMALYTGALDPRMVLEEFAEE
jgi:phosphoribosylformimino-5-aminoimidazole carboxamide ribotide isomerase